MSEPHTPDETRAPGLPPGYAPSWVASGTDRRPVVKRPQPLNRTPQPTLPKPLPPGVTRPKRDHPAKVVFGMDEPPKLSDFLDGLLGDVSRLDALHLDGLREYLRGPAATAGGPYNARGVLVLLLALADNLRASAADPSELTATITPEQTAFLERLAGSAGRAAVNGEHAA